MDELDRVLEVAKRAARAGGAIARATIDAPNQHFAWKRSRDPFVAQSLDVQNAVLATIRESFPDHAILAEEGPEDEEMPVGADPLWIVDPICGSLNYMHRDPAYAVSVGFLADGAWQVGVVYEPERDAMFTGVEGRGARLNDRAIVVDQFADGVEAFQRAAVGIDWPGDMDARKEMLTVVGTLVPVVLSVRVIGSPALGLCYVAGRPPARLLSARPAPVGRRARRGHPAVRRRHPDQFLRQLVVPLARRWLRGLQLDHPRSPPAISRRRACAAQARRPPRSASRRRRLPG